MIGNDQSGTKKEVKHLIFVDEFGNVRIVDVIEGDTDAALAEGFSGGGVEASRDTPRRVFERAMRGDDQ